MSAEELSERGIPFGKFADTDWMRIERDLGAPGFGLLRYIRGLQAELREARIGRAEPQGARLRVRVVGARGAAVEVLDGCAESGADVAETLVVIRATRPWGEAVAMPVREFEELARSFVGLVDARCALPVKPAPGRW